jgi:hypothetical protein
MPEWTDIQLRACLVPQKFCKNAKTQNGAAAHQKTDTKIFGVLLFSYQKFCITDAESPLMQFGQH